MRPIARVIEAPADIVERVREMEEARRLAKRRPVKKPKRKLSKQSNHAGRRKNNG